MTTYYAYIEHQQTRGGRSETVNHVVYVLDPSRVSKILYGASKMMTSDARTFFTDEHNLKSRGHKVVPGLPAFVEPEERYTSPSGSKGAYLETIIRRRPLDPD